MSQMPRTDLEWVQAGRAAFVARDVSEGFDRYLNRLSWLGSGLDWSTMPRAERISLARATPDEQQAWLSRVRIGSHSRVAVWYSLERGGVVVPTGVALESLDELYWGAPGIRFAFGIDIVDGEQKPAYQDLLQYDGGEWVIAVVRAPLM